MGSKEKVGSYNCNVVHGENYPCNIMHNNQCGSSESSI